MDVLRHDDVAEEMEVVSEAHGFEGVLDEGAGGGKA